MPTAITRYEGDMLFETEVGGQHITTDVTPPMGGKGRTAADWPRNPSGHPSG